MTLTRRHLLAGLAGTAAAGLPATGLARVTTAPRPRPRPDDIGLRPAPQGIAERILARRGMTGLSAISLRDLSDGSVVDEHQPRLALPPASVSKVVTALFGLGALGPDYRFRTQVAISGAVENGRLQGDLYLIGGGDPHLDTDGLADLARAVAGAGITSVAGRAWVVSGALPYHHEIDPTQPVHVGYNPAISGLNLNFNRVHFEWKPEGGRYSTRMTARGTRYDPAVARAQVEIVERSTPIFDYRDLSDGREHWSVARAALGGAGARWLPVRVPDLYAAEVFRVVAQGQGLRLPLIERASTVPEGLTVVAEAESAALSDMTRAMLKYSTNLTAEVTGLRAAQARGGAPDSIRASAAAMSAWLRITHGAGRAEFLNHSGLTEETRVTPAELVQILDIAASGPLPGLLKEMRYKTPLAGGATVLAKTGTLNFVRGLAGYIARDGRPRYAFAILSSDLEARQSAGNAERPRGAEGFRGNAVALEAELLSAWAGRLLA